MHMQAIAAISQILCIGLKQKLYQAFIPSDGNL